VAPATAEVRAIMAAQDGGGGFNSMGPSANSSSSAPFVMDSATQPPWHAKVFYKVVAAIGSSGGGEENMAYVSIYDGVTRYTPGTAVCHPAAPDHGGGLYVSPTIEGCLRRDANMFPAGAYTRSLFSSN
jgi:hypothetical protein